MSTGNALKYGAAGAVAGSALGPVGTVAGGAIGAVAGALTGNGGGTGTSGGDASSGPRSNFTFGNTSPLSQFANQYAAKYDYQGAVNANRGYSAQNKALAAQNRGGPIIQGSDADRQAQLAALGGTNASAAALQGNAAALQAMGTAPTNTNIAASQLKQGQDAAMQQSLALAHSGRSLGSGAAALQQAQFNNAQTEQATNQQAATANLQEQQQNRQMQLAALGASQQGYSLAGQGYGLAGQQANAINSADIGLQAQNAGLQQQQQQVNNQTSATLGQIGQGMEQTGLAEQQLGFNTRATQLNAGMQYQNSINGNAVAGQAHQDHQNDQTMATLSSAAGAAATAYASDRDAYASDRDAKKNVMPAADDPAATESPLTSWRALARSLGMTHAPEANPGAAIRDPHNPSQMISPYASISDASHQAGAAPTPAYTPREIAAYQPKPQGPAPIFAPGTPPPDTWGGAATPVQPAFTPQAPDLSGLDAAYSAQNQPPAGFQISDAHSKARIEALSARNRSLVAALSSAAPPTREMLNQAAADQDAATPGARIEYRDPGAPPTAAMLAQAAADQDAAPAPPPDRPAIDLRPAAPYSYEYKDPERHGQGRFYGPMAQDLEKTPAGASVVKQAPDGTKMVDTSRLSLVNTGAISDLQRQVAALGGRPQKYPAFMTPRGY